MRLIILLTFVVCVSCFDYLLFVQLWPGSWIHEDAIKYNFTNNYNTIHGIWPQYFNGTYPEFCNNKTIFNATKIANIYKNLTKYWTNFANTHAFLSHEFSKHFTCAVSAYTDPYVLFTYGLQLREKYNFYRLFASNDIYPSNQQKYETNKLNFIIKQAFGVNTIIICDANDILNEIRFCMMSDLHLFDCPVNLSKDKCNNTMIWYNKIIY